MIILRDGNKAKTTDLKEGGMQKAQNLSNIAMENRGNYKKNMDKFSNSFYNDYKERTENKNNGSALAHSFIDWKMKNRDSIKYAGDNALESMKKGFADTAKFMKDAGKSSKLEDVENTAVKWQLANDANNEELYRAAQNEMIGHLSDENKEPYLKSAVPLSDYIEAKDAYDYNNGNYTTTKYLNTQPDEKVKQIQNQLNSMGYTDKFGNPLKEDGIAGSKTMYAFDKFDENTNSKNSRAQSYQPYMKENVPLYSPEQESNNAITVSNTNSNSTNFDYNTRLSYSQRYNKNVEILQNELVYQGYLDMSDNKGWGYFGKKTQDAVNRYKNDHGLGNTGKDAGVVGKDTWTSLGLLWRTEKDVDAGVEIVTVGLRQYYDLSEAVSKALYNAKSEFEQHKNDLIWFYNQVCNKGDWNIKSKPDKWTKSLNISDNSFYKKFFLFGNFIDSEDLGNITYGYLGKAAGFSDFTLFAGSVGNDLSTHGISNLKNEYNDHANIQAGIDWYNGKDIGAKIREKI